MKHSIKVWPINKNFLIAIFIIAVIIFWTGVISYLAHDQKAKPVVTEQVVDPAVKLKDNLELYIANADLMKNSGIGSATNPAYEEMGIEIRLFEQWALTVDSGKESGDTEMIGMANTLEKKTREAQLKEFPLLRKQFAKKLADDLWLKDVEVNVSGARNENIEFVGYMYASNQNISDSYEASKQAFKDFRFKRVVYRWSKGADGSGWDLSKEQGFLNDSDVFWVRRIN